MSLGSIVGCIVAGGLANRGCDPIVACIAGLLSWLVVSILQVIRSQPTE